MKTKITDLPSDIISLIYERIKDLKDIRALANTCRSLRSIFQDSVVQKRMLQEHFQWNLPYYPPPEGLSLRLQVLKNKKSQFQVVHTFTESSVEKTALAIVSERSHLLAGATDGNITVWDLQKTTLITELQAHETEISAITVSQNGTEALCGSSNGTISLWDLTEYRLKHMLTGHDNQITHLVFFKHIDQALSGSSSYPGFSEPRGSSRLWDLTAGACLHLFVHPSHSHGVTSITLLPKETHFISSHFEGKLVLWNVQDKSSNLLEGHQNYISCTTLLPDEEHCLSGSYDMTLRLWNLTEKRSIHTFVGHKHAVTDLSLLPEKKQAISTSYDRYLRLWDVFEGTCLKEFKGCEIMPMRSVQVLPGLKSSFYITSAQDRRAIEFSLWNLETYQKLVTLKKPFKSPIAWDLNHLQAVVKDPDGTLHHIDLAAFPPYKRPKFLKKVKALFRFRLFRK